MLHGVFLCFCAGFQYVCKMYVIYCVALRGLVFICMVSSCRCYYVLCIKSCVLFATQRVMSNGLLACPVYVYVCFGLHVFACIACELLRDVAWFACFECWFCLCVVCVYLCVGVCV